jgi:hypothetical protein
MSIIEANTVEDGTPLKVPILRTRCFELHFYCNLLPEMVSDELCLYLMFNVLRLNCWVQLA